MNIFTLICAAALCGSPVRHTRDGLDKHRPSWSPDGKSLLFARQEADGANIWLYLLDVSGDDPARRLDRREVRVEYNATFAPDGREILFASISLSGTQGNVDIAKIAPDGEGFQVVMKDPGALSHQDWPSVSPDGTRFAFSSTHEGNQEIYTAKRDGTDLVRLTQNPGHDAHPCWSPGGRSIVFASDRWGGLEIAKVQPDGTGLERLTTSPGLDDYPSVSPDGRRIAFVSNRDAQFDVYVLDADRPEPINVSQHPGRDTFPHLDPRWPGRDVRLRPRRRAGRLHVSVPRRRSAPSREFSRSAQPSARRRPIAEGGPSSGGRGART